MYEKKQLDMIIPLPLSANPQKIEELIQCIRFQHERYGFNQFTLYGPTKGYRSTHYPSREHFRDLAHAFIKIREELKPLGLTLGWWNTLTMKSGPSEEFTRITRADGSLAPFANCPLDPAFQKRMAEDMAEFCRIAKPANLFVEDDYSIFAASNLGCFCPHHLAAFSKRMGKEYTREELAEILQSQDPAAVPIIKAWRELNKESLVEISKVIREELDKDSPEINLGLMEPGSAMKEGFITEDVARAMAAKGQIPFCRVCGVFYGHVDTYNIPSVLFHPLYIRQHIKKPFHFLHESDTYPHSSFYGGGAHMRTMMATVYSYGFEGSTFQISQGLDDPNEDTAYGDMFAKERPRFNEVYSVASQCHVKGVEMSYDPFFHTLPGSHGQPVWINLAARFGIAHASAEASVAFWDSAFARHADDETVKKYLSKGLFLDAEAAKILCERGYGEYLGVEIGAPVIEGRTFFDLGCKEIIEEKFARPGKGRIMPCAHCYAPYGNGTWLEMKITDPACEIISKGYNFQQEYQGVYMTRFENKLGGRIVVLGQTMAGNHSQAMFNHRRQRLFQDLLCWCADEYVFTKEHPGIFTIVNEADDPEKSGFKGMLTLINLLADARDSLSLHLPPYWQDTRHFKIMDAAGNWQSAAFEKQGDELILHHEFAHLTPVYILAE